MKRYKMLLLLIVAVPIALAAFWLVSTSRAAVETPDYKVIRTDGKFEMRDYPQLTIASTPMEGAEMNRGFGQLFRFITGSNEGSEKIEMTSPVLIDTTKDKKTISFIMPKKAVEKGVPKPNGSNVSLSKIEAARFAVLRFEGGRSDQIEKVAIEKLKAWLVAQKVSGKGEAIFAFYDPPWTPIPLRRNEVMIQIENSHE